LLGVLFCQSANAGVRQLRNREKAMRILSAAASALAVFGFALAMPQQLKAG
jgi:hypothetical protein